MATPSFLNRSFFAGLGVGIILGVGVAFLAGLAFVWMASAPGMAIRTPAFPDLDALSALGEADPGWVMSHLEGGDVTLGDYRGQVVFLNLWATWCAPCVTEMPNIQQLAQSLDGEEVAFLLVSNEDATTVLGFLESQQLDLPVMLSDTNVPREFRAKGIPATYIIDREGRIVFHHVGAALWDDPASLEFIRGLL